MLSPQDNCGRDKVDDYHGGDKNKAQRLKLQIIILATCFHVQMLVSIPCMIIISMKINHHHCIIINTFFPCTCRYEARSAETRVLQIFYKVLFIKIFMTKYSLFLAALLLAPTGALNVTTHTTIVQVGSTQSLCLFHF